MCLEISKHIWASLLLTKGKGGGFWVPSSRCSQVITSLLAQWGELEPMTKTYNHFIKEDAQPNHLTTSFVKWTFGNSLNTIFGTNNDNKI